MILSDRTVLITGASSGIGRALAQQLADRGCRIVITGRSEHRLAAVAADIDGVAIVADLASAAGVKELAMRVACEHRSLSVVINNAAEQRSYRLFETDPEQTFADIATEIQTDLTAPLQLTALLMPTLRHTATQTGQASAMVNLTTGLVLAPKQTSAVYCAAKAGLRTFTKALRFQAHADRLNGGPELRAVEAMLPMVDTAMTAGRGRGKISPDQAAAEILRGLEQGRSEIFVGKTQGLRILHGLAPSIAGRLFQHA